MPVATRHPLLALSLLAALSSASACGGDDPPSVLLARLGAAGTGSTECVEASTEPGAMQNAVIESAGNVRLAMRGLDREVSVEVTGPEGTLKSVKYDAAFLGAGKIDRFEVQSQGQTYPVLIWAATTCGAPVPGESGVPPIPGTPAPGQKTP